MAPTPLHDDDGAQPLFAAVSASGLWPLMRRVQRDTLGLREMAVRISTSDDDALIYRPVFPDLLVAEPDPERPDRPLLIREMRQREHNGKLRWAWDELDIRDPKSPTYRVILNDGAKTDITQAQLGGSFSGESYPYRLADGTPFLPYVLYHAEATGRLWDVYSTRELVEGTLNVAVFYSLLSHVLRAASWPQKYAVNVRVPGTSFLDEDSDGHGRQGITTDPATVLMLEAEPGANAVIGQWQASADPAAMIEVIAKYERRLASFAGINSADQIRMDGDPRSGYAVTVSREAQREVQRRYEVQARAGDIELLEKSAAILNERTDSAYPETGYDISYHGIPLSLEERRMQRDELLQLLDAGLIDKATAYQELHPGMSRAQAELELAQIEASRQPAPAQFTEE